MRRETIPILIAAALLGGGGCNGTAEVDRILPAATIALQPAALGELERPAVELPHDRHVAALAKEGCTACHPRDPRGRLSMRFGRVDELQDRTALIELYHERCTTCHEQRARGEGKSGPTTCGECHLRRAPAHWARRPMAWDYRLHDRHSRAEERCERCHHVKNPDPTGRPVYKKGAEEGCRACHGSRSEGGVRSLREAAHASCVPCHLDRQQRHAEAGPVTCGGCHGAQQFKRLLGAPRRLLRGQNDKVAVRATATKRPGVLFDHKSHEATASFCSSCHHQGLASCGTCHTTVGSPRGKGVTFEAAHHDPSSERSCVGCHARRTAGKDCAGCHESLPTSAARGCAVCHRSPETPSVTGAPASQPIAATLPVVSEAFPETVTIKRLQKRYGPSVLPHRKIVARLAELASKSALARRFHGDKLETLCQGCHHRSPAASRPPACGSCHRRDPGRSSSPTADRPGLTAAYHRQCIGCHQAMGLGKTGCADCHKPAGSTEATR